MLLHTSHPHRIITTKCHKNTDISPDDGRMVARNMQRLIYILRINCAPSWYYLQDCTGIHGQEYIKSRNIEFVVPGTGRLRVHVLELLGSCVTNSVCNRRVNFLHTVREMTREIFRSENCN